MKNIAKLCTIAMIGLLVACGDKPTETTDQTIVTNQQIDTIAESTVDESKLPLHRVATISTYPPFATKDKNGVVTGFDIDVLKAIAKNQGFQVEFVTHPWEDLKDDLTTKKNIDIWTAGITIKDERKEFADFSTPYMNDNTVIMTLEDTSSTIAKSKIGVEQGTSDVAIAKSLVDNPQQVEEFPSSFIAIEALLQKKVDGIIGNEVVLAHMAQSFPEYKFKSEILKPVGEKQKQLGFMVKKGNPEFLNQINQGLKEIKANGEFDKIKKKWFGDLVQ